MIEATPPHSLCPMNVDVTSRGKVSEHAKQAAHAKVGRLDRVVKGPVLGARVVLIQEHNPRIELPARAEGEVNLAGRPVRAHAAAPTMDAAVDELAERLQRQLRHTVERMITRQRVAPVSSPGEWRHGTRRSEHRER
jgi:ribosomal subunit interface protein